MTLVRAESLSSRPHWGPRDWLALATIPAIFAISWIATAFTTDLVTISILDVSIRLLLLAALIGAYRQMLARHWSRFTRAPWRGTAVVISGAVITQLIITGTGGLVQHILPGSPSTDSAESTANLNPVTASPTVTLLILFLGFGPIATAFIEDTVFRHTLLLKLPIWTKPALIVGVILGNAILFGAIHYNNFGSLAGTIPYMAAGLFFNLVYLWTRNLWHVLLMHTLNNAILTLGGTLLIVALRPFIA